MVYRVIGIMSGSSLDGLDIAYVHLHSGAGKWGYTIVDAETSIYPEEWTNRLEFAGSLNARDYLLLHSDYGRYIGEQVNRFIQARNLDFQVQLVASHGHTVFHQPAGRAPGQPGGGASAQLDGGMTAQLGDGAAIAAVTGLQVVTDLRSLDVALGGQGAPIVPIGEKLLLPEYGYYLNLGGIANLSCSLSGKYTAFDVCPAGRVLNLLAGEMGEPFDRDGKGAAAGMVIPALLESLNGLEYYGLPYPKSLANEFGTQQVYGLIKASGCSTEDGLRTYVEHIAFQVARAVSGDGVREGGVSDGGDSRLMGGGIQGGPSDGGGEMLVTGGGAHNVFLTARVGELLEPLGIHIVIPDKTLTDYKEALVMGLIGVLRLRQEDNTFASVTGASRDSIGGALWNGTES
jgi:anhydro-N-acetylmuramic acid kinase